jgi:ketosteroid isomerase-like protein
MKAIYTTRVAIIVMLLFTNLFSQSQTKNMNQPVVKTDKETLSELNAQFIKNFINQDTIAHNKIIHKDFVCINGDGSIINREDYMKGWANSYQHSGYTSFSYTDEYIRIFGNTALVRSRTPYTKIVDGKRISGASVYTDTYIKEDGQWLCVQAQITRIIQ